MSSSYDVTVDYYVVLGVSKNATGAEIKRSYYELAKELHPDRTGGDLVKAEKFKVVLQAYEVLSDAFAKRAYDDARVAFVFEIPIPDDDGEDDSGTYDKPAGKPKRGRKPRQPSTSNRQTRANAPATPLETPPEFRERSRSQYSYTYPGSSSEKQSNPPKSPRGSPGSQPSSSPKDEAHSDKFDFFDYYEFNYQETGLLLRLRNNREDAKKEWRWYSLKKEEARYNFDFPDPFTDISMLEAMLQSAKLFEKSRRAMKKAAETRYNEHAARSIRVLNEERARRAGNEYRSM